MSNTTSEPHIFNPEMGEKPDLTRLFFVRHVINGSYGITWREDRDAEAQKLFKTLRIRPKFVRLDTPADYRNGKTVFGAVNVFRACITSVAHEKILPHATWETLLD